MEVIANHQDQIKEDSVTQNKNVRITYAVDEVVINHQRTERPIDYLQKPTNKSEDKGRSINNINTVNSFDHDESESIAGLFYRKSIVQQSIKQKSMLKRKLQELKQTKIRVYYFETQKSRAFNMEQLDPQMKVGSFIQHAIQQYCIYFHCFSPSNIETSTFDLKIDDSLYVQGMILSPINHDEAITNFINSTLYLVRRRAVSQIIERFESKMPGFEIFDVEMPRLNTQKRNQKLTLEKRPGNTFQTLLNKVFKTCDITQSPSEYILIECYKFKIYLKSQLIENIPQRKFELLKAKKKTYHDEIMYNNQVPTEIFDEIKGENWLIKNIYPTNQSSSKNQLSVIIDYGVLKGKMKFSIKNCEFVENYQTNFYSKMIQRFIQYPYEVKYSLLALNDAYESRQNLVLQFLSKREHITRRYPMPKELRMSFLQQILRLCRIYKKGIHRKNIQ